MKNLRFERLDLLSLTERKARTINFHPRLTVIKGANDVGKSSVIKSIYWALGANPKSIHRAWKNANVRALLTFSVDGIRYAIMRSGKFFAVFDGGDKLLLSTQNVTTELAPLLADILNFRLVLASRKGIAETPPPAYAFLPFYVNQEGSWDKPFAGFDSLGQYPDYRDALIDFHSGILGNEYYELEAEKKTIKLEADELGRDRRAVLKAVEKLGLDTKFSGLELSVEGHEAAIDRLLAHLRVLKTQRQERAAKLAQAVEMKAVVESQMKIAKLAIAELEGDARYAGTLEAEVFCPVCNTRHDNDFAQRYGILDDREACIDFISTSNQSLREMAEGVRIIEAEIRNADRLIDEVQKALAVKEGEVSLADVIESEGRRAADELFRRQINELDEQAGKLTGRSNDIAKEQKALKDPARRELIENFHAKKIGAYLRDLDVLNYDHDAMTKINGRIVETGSDQPRAVLAYNLALLDTINEYGNSFMAPMIIDSPNQQDQDEVNVAAMIKLIIQNTPKNRQTILASVGLHGIDPGDAEVIEFTEKLSVLQAQEFDTVSQRMIPLIQQMM